MRVRQDELDLDCTARVVSVSKLMFGYSFAFLKKVSHTLMHQNRFFILLLPWVFL